jgi:hypothetical protein
LWTHNGSLSLQNSGVLRLYYTSEATSVALASDASGNLSLNSQSVTFGANDSGGAGYRLLRVPNA